MASKKSKGAGVGALIGARKAPKAGKAGTKLVGKAVSSRGTAGTPYLKYAFFALAGLAVGALLARSGSKDGTSSSFTGTTGQHAPDPGSPAGQRGQTWGTGTPTDSAGGSGSSDADSHQRPGDPNETGAERSYSDPSSGPLIGQEHRGQVGQVPVQHEEIENSIRTRIGEDPRTMNMQHVNVEVNDGLAELRGVAPSEEAKQAAEEIAAGIDGVSEVRNLLTVESS